MWQSAETGPEVESVERPKRFGVAMLLEQLFGLLNDRATERINNKALPAVGLEVPVGFLLGLWGDLSYPHLAGERGVELNDGQLGDDQDVFLLSKQLLIRSVPTSW
jgi:hypothetical protein